MGAVDVFADKNTFADVLDFVGCRVCCFLRIFGFQD
jgi:hypothetical protein